MERKSTIKTKTMVMSKDHNVTIHFTINGEILEMVNCLKYLGAWRERDMNPKSNVVMKWQSKISLDLKNCDKCDNTPSEFGVASTNREVSRLVHTPLWHGDLVTEAKCFR